MPLFCTGLILDFGKKHDSSFFQIAALPHWPEKSNHKCCSFPGDEEQRVLSFLPNRALPGDGKRRLCGVTQPHSFFFFFFLALDAFFFILQDDRRATQDSLPQRTLIELDPAGPRYSHYTLSPFIFSPAVPPPFSDLLFFPSPHKQVPGCVQPH